MRIAREEMAEYLEGASNLSVTPHYMVVSPTYEHQAHELRATLADADSSRVRRDDSDPAIFEVIASNRIGWPGQVLGDWFLFGRKGKAVNVSFLNGQQVPTLVRDGGWTHLSVNYRATLDFNVWARNYRYCRKIGPED